MTIKETITKETAAAYPKLGVNYKYTRLQKRRPVKMIHAEVFSSRSEATKAEAAFKKLTRKQKER
ncbi:GIY-YIG nuclease family protein, partial [Enterococcus faecium]|uniref:GIY-YIG nuclease family protein n=1 Tax=Enterococcus faecium TaxID=1352 RepID=UPI0037BEBB5A